MQVLKYANDEGTLIIFKNGVIDKIFILKVTGFKQVDIINNKKIVKKDINIDNIGAWIFNLYNPIEYIYKFDGGVLNGKTLTYREIEKMGKHEKTNGLKMKELNNQPIIKNYIGPMFDSIDFGKIYLKYESHKRYNELSQ